MTVYSEDRNHDMSIAGSAKRLSSHIPLLVSLWRGGGKSGPLTPKEMKRAGDALLQLQRGLTGSRHLAGAGYMDDMATLGAYLLYYWPVSYLQVSSALLSSGIRTRLPREGVLKVLDLGSGPGPASSALADIMRDRPLSLTLVDSSRKALRMAQKILSSRTVEVTPVVRNLEKDSLSDLDGPFDIILSNHCLNELWAEEGNPVEKRAAFIREEILPLLFPHGLLFLGEPALLLTSRDLLSLRDTLIREDGLHVFSPCLGDCPCGALSAGPSHTCHTEVPWTPAEPMAALARTAGLDRESVKMTYVLLSRDPAAEDKIPEGTVHARVVSDAMTNKAGRVRYLLCDGKSRYAFSAAKGDAAAQRAGFFHLKRSDDILVSWAEERGDGLAFGEKTEIRILSSIR